MVPPKKIRSLRGRMPRLNFAGLLGVSQITLWRWEEGRAEPEGASLRLLELLRDYRSETLGLLLRFSRSKLEEIV